LAFLPGEILLNYVQEIQERTSQIASKTWCPSLDDYDRGAFNTTKRQHIIREFDFCDNAKWYDLDF
jgi:hypothetical protein